MATRNILRIVVIVLGVVVAVLLIISSNFALRARQSFRTAEAYLQSGNTSKAIPYYDTTIRNYSLLNFRVGKSRDRLLEIARSQEQQNKPEEALQTYQTLLSALAAIETGYSPRRQMIRELEQKVSELRRKTAQ